MIVREIELDCSCCGNSLEGPELEAPEKDPEGKVMCDDCYHDRYEFTCYWCEDYAHVDQRGVGHFLIVTDGPACGIETGVYQIKGLPYYMDNMFYMWFIESALELTTILLPDLQLPIEWSHRDYPAGHLCVECERKLRGK